MKVIPGMPSHILVADDERSIRMMLEAGLKLNGFRVTCAPTGSRALEVARSGGIDAVLSDVYMPDGGGLELIRNIRSIDPAIPMISSANRST
jgi:two-component system OmpR family response regulator